MTGLELRTAVPRDRDAVIDLIQALNVHEAAITGDRLRSRAAAEAYCARLHERIALRDGRLVVAVAQDQVVGLVGFVVEEDEPFIRGELRRYGYVTDLVVHEHWRGRGIGRRLLAEAERLSREKGLKRLSIGVLAGNGAARSAYEAFGFRDYVSVLVKPLD